MFRRIDQGDETDGRKLRDQSHEVLFVRSRTRRVLCARDGTPSKEENTLAARGERRLKRDELLLGEFVENLHGTVGQENGGAAAHKDVRSPFGEEDKLLAVGENAREWLVLCKRGDELDGKLVLAVEAELFLLDDGGSQLGNRRDRFGEAKEAGICAIRIDMCQSHDSGCTTV